jgi:hypothetical protein
MLKTAWLTGSPPRSRWLSFVLSEVAIFADIYRRLNRAPEAEMAYRKESTRTGTTLFDPALGRASKNNNFRALSKSDFAKRLRV